MNICVCILGLLLYFVCVSDSVQSTMLFDPVCLSVCLSVCPSVCPSVCLASAGAVSKQIIIIATLLLYYRYYAKTAAH